MAVNVGSAVGYLDIDIQGFLDGLRTANSEAENQTKKFETSLEKFGKFGDKAQKAGTALTAFITTPLIAAGGMVVKFFGDLEQSIGGTEAVFGASASKIQSLADDAYINMGASANKYMETANKMASLFQGSGLDQVRSLDLTTEAMQRAADVASVMGISTESALESITGAAKGNFTMMDNLGVAMNATTLKAYALEKGVNFEWETANNAQKAELAMSMFFDRTTQYAGNFARESEETINGSIGMMKAAWENFIAGLGNSKANMKKLQSNLVESFKVVVNNIKEVLGNIWDNIPLPDWAKWAVVTVAALGPVLTIVGTISKTVVSLVGAYKTLNTVMTVISANPMTLTFIGAAAAIAAVVVAVTASKKAYDEYHAAAIAAREANVALSAAMSESAGEYAETVEGIEATDMAIQSYISRLDELQEKTSLTSQEQREQALIVEQLKGIIPTLNVEIDTQTGKIQDGTQAIKDNVQAWKDSELVKAILQKQRAEIDALAEAKIKLAKAEQEYAKKADLLAKKQAEQTEIYAQIREELTLLGVDVSQMTDSVLLTHARHSASTLELAATYDELYWDIEEAGEALETQKVAVDQLTETYNLADQQIIDTATAVGTFGTAVDSANTSVGNLQLNVAEVPNALDRDVIKPLKETSRSVINNFKEIEFSSEVTIEGLIKNLQKNEAVFSATMGSMEQLADKGINKGVLAYLFNLGPQGWEYLNKLALSTDEEMAEFERLMLAAGKGGSDSFLDEIEALPPDVKDALGIIKADAIDAGKQLPAGMTSGIQLGTSSLNAAARAMARSAVRAARAELVINSPSGAFRDEVGKWIPMGIAEGVEDEMPDSAKDIQKTIGSEMSKIEVGMPVVNAETDVKSFAAKVRDIYSNVANWFDDIEDRITKSIDKMADSMQAAIVLGQMLSPAYAFGTSYTQQVGAAPIQQQQQTQQRVLEINVNFNNYAGDIDDSDAKRIGREIGIEVDREMRSKGVLV